MRLPSLKKFTPRDRVTAALYLSAILHLPLIVQSRQVLDLWEQRGIVAKVLVAKAKSLVTRDFNALQDFKGGLREKLEDGERIDLAEFHLTSSYLEGYIDEDTKEASEDILDDLVAKHRALAAKLSPFANINRMISEMGEYSPARSLLSSPLDDELGNCQAREKFMLSLVQRVYPELPIQSQIVKINGGRHIRGLVRLGDNWYTMEKPGLQKLQTSDFERTVLLDENDVIESYAGKPTNVHYEWPTTSVAPTKTPTKLTVTDNYLDVKLPVPSSIIRDIGVESATGSKKTGNSGVIGSQAQRSEAGIPFPKGKGRDNIEYAPEFDVLGPVDAERLLDKASKWRKYLAAKMDGPSLPNFENWRGEAVISLKTLLNSYMVAVLNNKQERVPSDSCIISHSFFQNYSLPYISSNIASNTNIKEIIHRSEALQDQIYEWAVPQLRKMFVALDPETRNKHLKTLLHLREYLRNYDHGKEEGYFQMTDNAEDHGVFTSLTPDEFERRGFSGRFCDNLHLAPLKQEDQQRYSNRYAEAFIIRRINYGMSVERAKYWVEKGISEMQALMSEPQVDFNESD